jgi:hypothetical protein
VKLTTPLHPVPRSRRRGYIPPLLQYSLKEWCSVKKDTGTTLPFNCICVIQNDLGRNYDVFSPYNCLFGMVVVEGTVK